ncbi:MAG: hypothetical protein QM730_05295 [Anaerolineales bacterium]
MDAKQNSKSNWSGGVLIAASIPILLIIVGIIAMLGGAGRTDPVTGVTDTTVENAVFFGGLYLAVPLGLLDVIVGSWARSRNVLKKKFTLLGISIGAVGILLGLLAWAFFIMMSSFVF